MHRTYRQLLFALLSIISLAITCNKCRQTKTRQEWTPQLETQMYDVFYQQSASFTTDENAKKEYADCCLAKIKQLFPKGISNMESQMSDSVKIVIMKMGSECALSFKSHINIWQPEVIQQLKLQFYSYAETKLLPENIKKEYVDCIAFKVMTKFPNGFEGNNNKDTLKNVIQKARKDCLKLIINKFQKLKQQRLKDTN
ncbi:hypothetical protein [Mucilaginibacter sp.]|uniref:hypothetical protein n=1 Tax=Mucilaginibacter sp. TaxID=1882438 RepID=UPI00260CE637|nr:hypothetical protein [Mucilaginibacter sp.]MDB4920074.1 hypothetical protein [Mucilaginibacter sp.]